MGGSAFPDTVRLTEAERQRVVAVVTAALESRGDGVKVQAPVEVHDKAELCRALGKDAPYGDVDFVVGVPPTQLSHAAELEIVERVREALGSSSATLKNHTTFSFLTSDRHQVDLEFCHADHFTFLVAFKANNDFGALLGHLLTPLKLKFSHTGLSLRLKVDAVRGFGTRRMDLLLTSHLGHICDFLGLPASSLDGVTSLSSRQIFETLTSSRVFFQNKFDARYKILQTRKSRPVCDAFFRLLEGHETELQAKKVARFHGDKVEALFRNFACGKIPFDEYAITVAQYFHKGDLLLKTLHEMSVPEQSAAKEKFNFHDIVAWRPDLGAKRAGRVMQRIKACHSGERQKAFEEWVVATPVEQIRAEVCRLADTLPPTESATEGVRKKKETAGSHEREPA